ncbi:NUDIX hydrolase [Pengzhenrongella frigida]|uniref:NUDIX hydrolase n=1 Tax=Pengzhenrongella frigida TaxID=1259133 RepID=A0A4Q5N325_9MICO|nr:NUDIX domain-containing protein [Cellulomonas sp. HLT2-17]RYV51653.1 NUDIX hydrolase [Cellulomonas sp. HLT2-17]
MPPSTRPADDLAGFPPVAATVDLVALTVRDDALQVLVVTRTGDPHAGELALPGGFVHPDEDLDSAAARVLVEETGMRRPPGHLEQLKTYGAPNRDPRLRVVSVAYLAMAPTRLDPRVRGDAAVAAWVPVERALTAPLAFDHTTILTDAISRARSKLEYTSLAAAFCGPEFTVSNLRRVYEVVWGVRLDPRNFHRKVSSTPGFIIDTGHTVIDGPGRPAALYRRGPATMLVPPLTREQPDT